MQYSENVFSEYKSTSTSKIMKVKPIPTGHMSSFLVKKMFVTVNSKNIGMWNVYHTSISVGRKLQKGKVILKFSRNSGQNTITTIKAFTTQCAQCYKLKSCTQCIFTMETKDEKTIL